MTAKRAHRRKLNDPLVPVSGEYVRGVLQRAKLSEREAVRELGRRDVYTAQPTLDNIIRGRQVRCRKSLRDGIASLLRAPIPSEWLDGEHDSVIWDSARPGPDVNFRAKPDSPLGRAGRKLREQFGLPTTKVPPLYQLVAFGLTERMHKAGAPYARAHQIVHSWLSAALWQVWFVGAAAVGSTEAEEMDQFAVAASEALSIALRPWLSGSVTLRDDALERVARALKRVKDDAFVAGKAWEHETLAAHASEHPPTTRPEPSAGLFRPPRPNEAPLNFGKLVDPESGKRRASSPRKRAK